MVIYWKEMWHPPIGDLKQINCMLNELEGKSAFRIMEGNLRSIEHWAINNPELELRKLAPQVVTNIFIMVH